MRLLAAFLKLVRLPNLFFIVLTQFLFYDCILVPLLRSANAVAQIDQVQFILLSLASILIAAAGYIINDYFDVNIDQVNKPKKNVVDLIVSRRWAILWHFVLSGIGVLLSLYISWKTGLWYIVLANFACAFLLFGYSISLKQKLLSGNILISVLTSWVILILCLSEFRLSQGGPADGSWLVAENKIMRLGFLYAGFAFITSLIREAVKDMEDIEGDRKYGCKTMPIVWGIHASKIYTSIWLTTIILILFLLMIYMVQLHWWFAAIYCLVVIIIPLIDIFRKLYKAQTPQDFHKLSSLIKLAMLTGILSMIFFRIYS